ncbi:MAG: hypothetical protein IJO96_03815 [Oscillospiraceae bacterium]|nr:hypothetical protein [Oscillospiraceae bacterium]
MKLDSLGFIFGLLPISIILYAATPRKFRNYTLFVINAVYYLFIGWQAVAITAAAVAMDYGTAVFLDRVRGRAKLAKLRLPLLVLMAGKNIFGAIYFAVVDQMIPTAANFGFVVYAITATGYLVDVFGEHEKAEKDPIRFALFSTLFCKMYIGPLVRWKDMKDQLAGENGEGRRFLPGDVAEGLSIFLFGTAKKVLITDRLVEFALSLEQVNFETPTILGKWLAVIVFALRIFFELSAYSDMARGLALVFGIKLPRNFYYPYQSVSISDFLHRFNSTVTQFFEHYVYNALIREKGETEEGKAKAGVLSDIINTLLVCLLFSLWFGVNFNYMIWGIYLAVFIILEKYLLQKVLDNIPMLFSRLYAFVVIMLSFIIFASDNMSLFLRSVAAVFNFSTDLSTTKLEYLLSSNFLMLVVAVLFSSSLFSFLMRKLKAKSSVLGRILSLVWVIALTVTTVAFLL